MASIPLHKVVLPPVAAITILYPAAFLGSMWLTAASNGEREFTQHVTSGEIRYGWRYDVYARSWPQAYMVDVTAPKPGAGSLCLLEVRGQPKPAEVLQGEGSALYVRFESELKTGEDILRVDLFDALENRCAAMVADGAVTHAFTSPPADAQTAITGRLQDRLKQMAANGRGV